MHYPNFYEEVSTITLHDPLSEFLGACDAGHITISYLDCVKLAGHSCPTVAGAYLMALAGLERLYPDSLPERGAIRVAIREEKSEGVAGVMGNVLSLITGAADEGGFKGLQGRNGRNNLLSYGNDLQGDIALTRTDSGASVTLSYDPSIIPADADMMPLMKKSLDGSATPQEQDRFRALWQERVRQILCSRDLWNQMITVT